MVSIIIPVYNQYEKLKITLKSINESMHQSLAEVIVVDDGSEDSVDEVLELKYNFNLKLIKLKKNCGRSAARNIGVTYSTGDILIFVDADRFINREFINSHIKTLISSKKTVCIGQPVDFICDEENTASEFLKSKCNESKFFDKIRPYPYADASLNIFKSVNNHIEFQWICLFSGNFSIRKNDYLEIGGFDEKYTSWGLENIEFGLRITKLGYEILYNETAKNYHLYHKENRIINISSLKELAKDYNYKLIINYIRYCNGAISLGEFCQDEELIDVFIGDNYGKN